MIDFSSRHDVLILNPDGSLQPMDVPFFEAEAVAADTWKILSDGDFSYLAAGREQAVVIDTGYGSGDIRAFAQTLTTVPVRYAANTHDHFDHTANNSCFEAVYLSEATAPLACIPYPSFDGIDFPDDYEKRIVDTGDVIDLGGRELLVLAMPDHAVGSLLFLDKKERILFAGDELSPYKRVNGTVERIRGQLRELMAYRADFDTICAGPGVYGADLADRLLENADRILAGHEGGPAAAGEFRPPLVPGYEGRTIYERRGARPEDLPPDFGRADPHKRVMDFAGVKIEYDVRRVR